MLMHPAYHRATLRSNCMTHQSVLLPMQASGMKGSLYNRDEAMAMAGGMGGGEQDEDEVCPPEDCARAVPQSNVLAHSVGLSSTEKPGQ